MPLVLISPPALVSVRQPGGGQLPALLLGARDDRRYVQVSHGAGANHLRWVPAEAVEEAVEVPSRPATGDDLGRLAAAPTRGLPRRLR